MTERLLQFIWQFQYFNKTNFSTLEGEPLEIIYTGQFNRNQGPDFLNARIRIGQTILAGNIELHLSEADWNRHAHSTDPNYRNIILHVLWEPPPKPQLSLPTVSLKDRVSKVLLQRYRELMHSKEFVACMNSLNCATALTWLKWKERLLAERLTRKSALVQQFLRQSNQHWEEVFWWMLARNFGITVNTDAFEAVARSLPLNILARHRNHVHQLEALLLGQAGLLDFKDGPPENDRPEDDQPGDGPPTDDPAGNKHLRRNVHHRDQCIRDHHSELLADEYKFFRVKYQLKPVRQQVHFLRMRPGNFPTVRLAQLAALLHTSASLFSQVKECTTVKELYALLQVTPGGYWDNHYVLNGPTAFKKKTLGVQMIENIIINTIVPVLFAYGHLRNEQQYKDKSLEWLGQLAPEKNNITAQWAALGIENRNAWDSQALIELKKEYCDAKRCLECSIGNSLLAATKPAIVPIQA
jgi:hypothetical protein